MKRVLTTCAVLTIVLATPALGQPVNDDCTASDPLAGYGLYFFDNDLATTDGLPSPLCDYFSNDQIYNDIWFCWTAEESGPVKVSTCGLTGLDTKMAVYDGCSPCPDGAGIINCNDDSCASLQTEVAWAAVVGQEYLIRLGTYSETDFGFGEFEIGPNVVPTLAGPFNNPANGHDYTLLEASDWHSAEGTAVTLGGHLATINDADENEWVRANVLGFDAADRRGWLGLNDEAVEGTFEWVSGSTAAFRNWNGGEPNNSGGIEHYTEMFGSNGLWNDQPNSPSVAVYGVIEVGEDDSCAGFVCADANCNGSVDAEDIDPFFIAVGNPATYVVQFPSCDLICNCDVNSSGGVDAEDIDPFFVAVGVGGCP